MITSYRPGNFTFEKKEKPTKDRSVNNTDNKNKKKSKRSTKL